MARVGSRSLEGPSGLQAPLGSRLPRTSHAPRSRFTDCLYLTYIIEDAMALPENILARILESLYVDFLKSDECIDISKHHCSLLHPCIAISKYTTFKPIYTFRLISSNWNKVFLSTAKLDRYGFHRIAQGPHQLEHNTRIYDLLRKSVVLRRYRLFRNLHAEHLHAEHGTSDRILRFFFLSTDYYQGIKTY